MKMPALTKQNATLAFAVVGAATGLASLSMNVWEKLEYWPRVQITAAFFSEDRSLNRRPEFRVSLTYENRDKYRMILVSPPMLTVHHPDGRQFGPYLMMPTGANYNHHMDQTRVLQPLESNIEDYEVAALERAIESGRLSELRTQFKEFTFDVTFLVNDPRTRVTTIAKAPLSSVRFIQWLPSGSTVETQSN